MENKMFIFTNMLHKKSNEITAFVTYITGENVCKSYFF